MTRILITVVLLSITAIACVAFRGQVNESTPISSFSPNPMNDKVILVKGWNETEIQKIIMDFIATYEGDGYPAYTIEPHKLNDLAFRLTFPKDIHPTLFTFLVNYVAYPFDLDLKNRSVIVGAKTTLSVEFDGLDSSFNGKKAILYIPEGDQDYNVVYMQTDSGVTLANSFTEIKWRRVNDAKLSNEVRIMMASV
jgi:hypothetical protein